MDAISVDNNDPQQTIVNIEPEITIDDYTSDVFDDANKLLDAVTSSSQLQVSEENTEGQISLKNRFIDEIKNGKMFYSYKPVFIKAIFDTANENGTSYLYDIAMYFMNFYNRRKENGLVIENQDSVVCKPDFAIDDALLTIKRYPLDIYQKTKTVTFNDNDLTVSIVKEVWKNISDSEKSELLSICDKRIESYYSKNN